MGTPQAACCGLLAATALLYLVGPEPQRLGQRVLLGRGAGGFARAGRPGSSGRPTRRAPSPSTSPRPRCGLWVCRSGCSGCSSLSVLVPQALMGVASVGLLYAAVRRWSRAGRWVCSQAPCMAVTPVATLMFRFNNPDALARAAAGCGGVRGRARRRGRCARAGSCWPASSSGSAFLTKMLQAFLVVPGSLWPISSPARRSSGKRVAPAARRRAGARRVRRLVHRRSSSCCRTSMRPYIGGSQNNSILELTLGYNGLGRITGDETGSFGFGNGTGAAVRWRTAVDAVVRCRVRWSGVMAAAGGAHRAGWAAVGDLRARRVQIGCGRQRCSGAGGCSSPVSFSAL